MFDRTYVRREEQMFYFKFRERNESQTIHMTDLHTYKEIKNERMRKNFATHKRSNISYVHDQYVLQNLNKFVCKERNRISRNKCAHKK